MCLLHIFAVFITYLVSIPIYILYSCVPIVKEDHEDSVSRIAFAFYGFSSILSPFANHSCLAQCSLRCKCKGPKTVRTMQSDSRAVMTVNRPSQLIKWIDKWKQPHGIASGRRPIAANPPSRTLETGLYAGTPVTSTRHDRHELHAPAAKLQCPTQNRTDFGCTPH